MDLLYQLQIDNIMLPPSLATRNFENPMSFQDTLATIAPTDTG